MPSRTGLSATMTGGPGARMAPSAWPHRMHDFTRTCALESPMGGGGARRASVPACRFLSPAPAPRSEREPVAVRTERFLVEGLVEPRAGEGGEVADVAVALALVEAAGARVVGGGEQDEVVGPLAGLGLGGGQEPGAETPALVVLGDQQEPEVGGAGEDPAADDPGQPERRAA